MKRIGLSLIAWAMLRATLEAQSLSYGMTAKSGAVVDLAPAGRTAPVKVGTADPATCTVGDLLYRSDLAELRHCKAADTWASVGVGYTLPAATAAALGGIKVGSGLTVDATGRLSAVTSGYDIFDTSVVQWVEDFASGPATGSGAHVGMNNLAYTNLSSATGAFAAGDQNHPNLLVVTSHATNADSGAVIKSGAYTGTSPGSTSRTLFQNREWDFRVIFKLGSTTNARVRIGIGDLWSGMTGYHFVGLRYDTSAAYADDLKNGGSGSWVGQIYTATGGGGGSGDATGNYVIFNVAPDTGWHQFRVWRSGTTVSMSIDSTTKTFCASGCDTTASWFSTIGSDIAPVAMIAFESGSTDAHSVDWMAFKATGMVRP